MHTTFVEDVRGKLSTPQIHNASHVHRVNPITRLNGVKHAPQPPCLGWRLRMVALLPSPPLFLPGLWYILSRLYSPSPLFLFANPPIWLVTPIPFQFLPTEPVIPCRSSNFTLRREIALLGQIYAYPCSRLGILKKYIYSLIFIREAVLWNNFKKKWSCSKL